jgi:radical SAM protein with 4Fe4S-binding SPASM domain
MLDLQEIADQPAAFSQALETGAPYRPLYVKIKLTWRCNLRCVMCNVWRQRRKSLLTLPVMASLADELVSLGTTKVHLTGGEVMLHPEIFEIIAAFSERGLKVNLTSNGTLIDAEHAARLVESDVRNVSLSVDGVTPAVHDALRGKGTWKRTLHGMRNLHRAAKHVHRKLHIRVNTVVSRKNYLDLAGLPALIHRSGADRLTLIPVDDQGERLHLNKERILEYNERIAPELASQALALGLIADEQEAYPFGRTRAEVEWSKRGRYARGLYDRQPCYVPWLHAMIAPQGQVYACCMLRSLPPLGNFIQVGSFRKVWTGTAYQDFRREMIGRSRPEQCQACDDFLEENCQLHRLLQTE